MTVEDKIIEINEALLDDLHDAVLHRFDEGGPAHLFQTEQRAVVGAKALTYILDLDAQLVRGESVE